MTSRQSLVTAVGLTQDSSVIPAVGRRDAESGMDTRELVPSNTRALPNLADVVLVAPATVPVLPYPEESATVVPVASSKAYAATSDGAPPEPGVGEGDKLALGEGDGDGLAIALGEGDGDGLGPKVGDGA